MLQLTQQHQKIVLKKALELRFEHGAAWSRGKEANPSAAPPLSLAVASPSPWQLLGLANF